MLCLPLVAVLTLSNSFRLRQMHEMLTIVTDVRGVCLSVCLSVMRLKSAAAHAVYVACCVRGVIRCSLG